MIEESKDGDLQTAIDTYDTLRSELKGLRVGLLHGRLPGGGESRGAWKRSRRSASQVLVCTTVIEVGVDVPNASLMVIEHAERFGLAQLHQLRGRIGRGARESVCILLYGEPLSEAARARLKVIFENTDGFEIARARPRSCAARANCSASARAACRCCASPTSSATGRSCRRRARRPTSCSKHDPGRARAHVERWLGVAAGAALRA